MRRISHKLNWLALAALLPTCGVVIAQEPTDAPVVETDPAVLAALELPRTESSHYLQAVIALVELDRPQLAKPIFAELLQLNLNDQQRADLVEQFGTRRMLQLARTEALAPEGRQFADACMTAAAARAGLSATPANEISARPAPKPELISPDLQKLLDTGDAFALSAALADSLEADNATAVLALVEVLGQSGDANVLYTDNVQPSPLAEALVFPDRRVRFAAVEAIRALDPPSPFPGSSHVAKTLRYLATADGERRAVVLMPAAEHATTLAGRLAGIGYEADPTTRGGPAMRLAQQSADVEMIFVDYSIHSPGIRDMLYALRTDPATGRIPIALLATTERLLDATDLATEHTRIIAFPRPQSDEWLAHIVDELNTLAAHDRLSPEERAEIGRQARQWIDDRREGEAPAEPLGAGLKGSAGASPSPLP